VSEERFVAVVIVWSVFLIVVCAALVPVIWSWRRRDDER
jgi:hypothetical protein